MFHRVLVPLDGSELAETVCVYAKELAGRLDLDVVLLHVANPSTQGIVPMELAYIEHMAEIVGRQVKEVQKATDPEKKSKSVKVAGELAVGYSSEEILRFADQNAIDLIILASHGHSGLKRWTIGSVAGQVMSATKIPVWLIKPTPHEQTSYDKWPSKTLIVPLDGSELAESVLPHVEALAKQRGKEPLDVVLVRVSEIMTIPNYYSPDISGVSLNWGNILQEETIRRKQAAKDYLEGIEKRFKKNNIKVKSVVIEGRPQDEVVEYANKVPYSMIIMATHGRSGISRLVYGSVAANILHGVDRPIFMIKPQ